MKKEKKKINLEANKHKYLDCSVCGMSVLADSNAVSVVCAKCFRKQISGVKDEKPDG